VILRYARQLEEEEEEMGEEVNRVLINIFYKIYYKTIERNPFVQLAFMSIV